MNKVKLNWMRKLASAKNYVVITDKEAIINVRGLSSDNFTDVLKVANQQAELVMFREKLDEVIKKYDKAISSQMTVAAPKRKPTRKGKKIEVKEG